MFPYTLALCMWQTFAAGHSDINAAVPELWQAAAEALAANRNWDMLDLSSPAGLACFTKVAPNEVVPEDMALKAFNTGSPVWSEVPVAALPSLLLLQNYLQLAHAHKANSVDTCKHGAAEVIAALTWPSSSSTPIQHQAEMLQPLFALVTLKPCGLPCCCSSWYLLWQASRWKMTQCMLPSKPSGQQLAS